MKKKISIFYWSPYLGKVATIRSVINSAISLQNHKKNNKIISIIDCYGEWNYFKKKFKKNKIKIIKLQNLIKFKTNAYGFFKSRFIYIATFFFTYFKLKKLLALKNPNYLVVHLLTFVPFILFFFNNIQTKLILRISGKPKLYFLRLILWKMLDKKINKVFCPTIETKKIIDSKKIFDSSKVFFLPDPVINDQEITELEKYKIKNVYSKYTYFLTIGRFTKQKNHDLIIDTINKYKLKDKFLFIGEGELKEVIQNKINRLKLNSQIKILSYQKNIFQFIKESKAVLISSLWEDPGFVMIEAAHLKKSIISSDCASGPKEFLDRGRGGHLFKSNSSKSLFNTKEKFKSTSKNKLKTQIIYAKHKSRIYRSNYHMNLFSKYLDQ